VPPLVLPKCRGLLGEAQRLLQLLGRGRVRGSVRVGVRGRVRGSVRVGVRVRVRGSVRVGVRVRVSVRVWDRERGMLRSLKSAAPNTTPSTFP
jgi:hypothetical protein